MKNKPKHQHDCDECIYLGTVNPVDDKSPYIDCYWCPDTTYAPLSSIIGRFGSEGPEYASTHPPENFELKNNDYLKWADRWYLYALLIGYEMGLWNKTREEAHQYLKNKTYTAHQMMMNGYEMAVYQVINKYDLDYTMEPPYKEMASLVEFYFDIFTDTFTYVDRKTQDKFQYDSPQKVWNKV